MTQHPIPVVICSSLAEQGSDTAFKALEYGAVEIITKPKLGTRQFLEESRIRICDAVKAAAMAKMRRRGQAPHKVEPKLTADAVICQAHRHSDDRDDGESHRRGGLHRRHGGHPRLSGSVAHRCPGTVIVQHMPENFTAPLPGGSMSSAACPSRRPKTTIRSCAGRR